MKKKSYIPLVSEVIERNSLIHICKYEGKQCLYIFIKTRYHQPDKCLNCLKELEILHKYQLLKQTKYSHKKKSIL